MLDRTRPQKRKFKRIVGGQLSRLLSSASGPGSRRGAVQTPTPRRRTRRSSGGAPATPRVAAPRVVYLRRRCASPAGGRWVGGGVGVSVLGAPRNPPAATAPHAASRRPCGRTPPTPPPHRPTQPRAPAPPSRGHRPCPAAGTRPAQPRAVVRLGWQGWARVVSPSCRVARCPWRRGGRRSRPAAGSRAAGAAPGHAVLRDVPGVGADAAPAQPRAVVRQGWARVVSSSCGVARCPWRRGGRRSCPAAGSRAAGAARVGAGGSRRAGLRNGPRPRHERRVGGSSGRAGGARTRPVAVPGGGGQVRGGVGLWSLGRSGGPGCRRPRVGGRPGRPGEPACPARRTAPRPGGRSSARGRWPWPGPGRPAR